MASRWLPAKLRPDGLVQADRNVFDFKLWRMACASLFNTSKAPVRANSTVLRSKTPDRVLQERWALLPARFAIRQWMAQAACPRPSGSGRAVLHARCFVADQYRP